MNFISFHILSSIVLASFLVNAADPALPPASDQTVVVVAAEHPEDKIKIRETPGALTGKAVVQTGDYLPLVHAPLPEEGDTISVWIRYRGLALQVKAIQEDGKRVELPWNWKTQPDEYAWRLMGTYSREMLGTGVQVIHAPNIQPESGLDILILTSDPSVRPDGSAALEGMPNQEDATVKAHTPPPPESDMPGEAVVTLTSEALGPVAPLVYGLNAFQATRPSIVRQPEWKRGISYMDPGLLRIHHAGLTGNAEEEGKGHGWWDPERKDWDYTKIHQAAVHWRPSPELRLMLNISSWPEGMTDGNRLAEDQLGRYTVAVVDLVRFLNVELNSGIEYVEITNEKDGAYWVAPSRRGEDFVEDLVKIHNNVAVAVRAVDPDIHIGGPAAMRPDYTEHLKRFVEGTKGHLDFLSVHAYASGNLSDPDQLIYNKIERMAGHCSDLVSILRDVYGSGAAPELHLNEYNISWTWETMEPRMKNHKGAVFDAIALGTFAGIDGLTATNAWNEMDGVYGKMDGAGHFRPGAHVFHLFNAHHQGERLAVSSDAPERVVPFATRDGEQTALTLVNRVNGPQTVTLHHPVSPDVEWKSMRIDADGVHKGEGLPGTMVLPPHSVTTYWQE